VKTDEQGTFPFNMVMNLHIHGMEIMALR